MEVFYEGLKDLTRKNKIDYSFEVKGYHFEELNRQRQTILDQATALRYLIDKCAILD